MAGPAFEYNDYIQGIVGCSGKDKKKTPTSFLPGLTSLAVGILALALHLGITANFDLQKVHNVDFIASHSMYYRYGFTWVVLMGDRFKYYFAWKVAEGASILAGFGFEGFDANGKPIGWKGVENIDIPSFESRYICA